MAFTSELKQEMMSVYFGFVRSSSSKEVPRFFTSNCMPSGAFDFLKNKIVSAGVQSYAETDADERKGKIRSWLVELANFSPKTRHVEIRRAGKSLIDFNKQYRFNKNRRTEAARKLRKLAAATSGALDNVKVEEQVVLLEGSPVVEEGGAQQESEEPPVEEQQSEEPPVEEEGALEQESEEPPVKAIKNELIEVKTNSDNLVKAAYKRGKDSLC